MSESPYLSVIIPAYNEERRIGRTLDAIHTYLQLQTFSWEILVVLDGVSDNTLDVITAFADQKAYIRWIDRKENRGKGYTVREGMLAANGTVRLFTDADNSTDISHFDLMRPEFDAGVDVAICSRDSKDVSTARQAVPQPFLKRMLGDLGNLFIQIMAVRGIWDTQCGFKAFSAEAAQQIFTQARIDGWGFDIEALALARRFGYTVKVLPADWVDDAETHVSLLNYFGTFWETVKIRWYLSTGKYGAKSSRTAR